MTWLHREVGRRRGLCAVAAGLLATQVVGGDSVRSDEARPSITAGWAMLNTGELCDDRAQAWTLRNASDVLGSAARSRGNDATCAIRLAAGADPAAHVSTTDTATMTMATAAVYEQGTYTWHVDALERAVAGQVVAVWRLGRLDPASRTLVSPHEAVGTTPIECRSDGAYVRAQGVLGGQYARIADSERTCAHAPADLLLPVQLVREN